MTEKERFFFNAIRLGDLAIVKKELTDKPNLIDITDDRGSSPLILASYYDHIDLTQILIQAGATVNFKDSSGNTALMGVCFKGVVELAELLINHGADVNITNVMGTSALIFAAMFNRKDMVELLLENKADKTIATTPINIPVNKNCLAIIL